MVRCPDCETPNSVDSKFCRFCGAALPEEDRVEAQLKLNELVAEGYKLFNDGRTDEALIVAESAIASNPNEPRALSLKGMCLERAGNLADALELYERVVELNPDSALDKVKMTHVRNQLAAKAAAPPPPNRRLAMVGAVSAIVFVMAVGAIIAAAATNSTPKTSSVNPSTTADQAQMSGFEASLQQPVQDARSVPTNTGQTATSDQAQGNQNQVSDHSGGSAMRLPGLPGNEIGPIAPDMRVLPGDDGPKAKDDRVGSQPPNSDPPPAIDTKQTEPPPEDHGYIDIVVHRGPQGSGGSQSADGSNQLAALLRTGRDQFQRGDYQAAVRTFEQAIGTGGDPAALNQRIGQCYMNLGKKGEAINAYTKAVDSFKSELASHDSPTLRAGLEACTQALKVLRG